MSSNTSDTMITTIIEELNDVNDLACKEVMKYMIFSFTSTARFELEERAKTTKNIMDECKERGISGPDSLTLLDQALKAEFPELNAEKYMGLVNFIIKESERLGYDKTEDRLGRMKKDEYRPQFPMFFFRDTTQDILDRQLPTPAQVKGSMAYHEAVNEYAGKENAGIFITKEMAEKLAFDQVMQKMTSAAISKQEKHKLTHTVILPKLLELTKVETGDISKDLSFAARLRIIEALRMKLITADMGGSISKTLAKDSRNSIYRLQRIDETQKAWQVAKEVLAPLLNQWENELNEYIENGTPTEAPDDTDSYDAIGAVA